MLSHNLSYWSIRSKILELWSVGGQKSPRFPLTRHITYVYNSFPPRTDRSRSCSVQYNNCIAYSYKHAQTSSSYSCTRVCWFACGILWVFLHVFLTQGQHVLFWFLVNFLFQFRVCCQYLCWYLPGICLETFVSEMTLSLLSVPLL